MGDYKVSKSSWAKLKRKLKEAINKNVRL